MKWSWEIGKPFGIPVRVHVTFLLLLAFVLFSGENGKPDFFAVVILAAVFAGVILHELGHSLAARGYGIRVNDITLWPLGGIARLERFPDRPGQQIVIAAAGPAVSFLLAGILGAAVMVFIPNMEPVGRWQELLFYAAEINLILGLFNLIPALPMDGGRILRGVLALTPWKEKATYISARLGQVIAVGLAGLALYMGRPWLAMIAVFVFLSAEQEWRAEAIISKLRSVWAWEAMLKPVATAGRMTSIGSLADYATRGEQRDFPVIESGNLVGLITRWDIMQAMMEGRRDEPAFTIMERDILTVSPLDTLDRLLTFRLPFDRLVMPVVDRMRVVGLLTPERLEALRSR